MSLREKLKALEELQQIDLEANEVRGEIEALPARRAKAEAGIVEARRAYDDSKQRLDANERERRQVETLLQMERDKVKKWEGRLGEIKTPREYAAMSREIDIAKKANTTMAEELVELGKIQAQLREVVKGKDQQYAAKVGDVGGKLNDLRAKVAGFEGQVKELEAKRAEVAKGVHPPLLSRYETVRKRRTPALVTVVAGTCQGCNMSVPPQLYNTLKTTLETDICPSCHRIICAPEAIEPPPAKKG